MGTQPIDYEAVIADLEAKKAQLEATIAMLRALSGIGTLGITPPNIESANSDSLSRTSKRRL